MEVVDSIFFSISVSEACCLNRSVGSVGRRCVGRGVCSMVD